MESQKEHAVEVEHCLRCGVLIEQKRDICPECGCPLSNVATTLPLERVYAEAFAYRDASKHPRKLIVVIGMWLLWGPMLLVGIGGGVASLYYTAQLFLDPRANPLPGLLALAVCGVILYVPVKLLKRTTSNYAKFRARLHAWRRDR